MRTRSILVASLLAVATLTLVAQQPQPPAPPRGGEEQPPITFKVEINYVEIDAVVTDAQGNFVRSLKKDDFQVLEDGKPQDLSIFSIVDIPVERADPPLFAVSPIEPDVRTNRKEFDGRILVLVLDDLQTHFARSARVKAAAKQFIERYVGANDVVAVVTTGAAKGTAQEFTSSKRLMLRAVDGFMGQKLRSATLNKIDDYYVQRDMNTGEAPRDISEPERAFRARNSLSTLKGVAEYMSGIRGRRKAVVFFSEGIDYDVNDTITNRYATDIRDEAQQAIAAATRANVSFYTVDPRGLGGLSDEMMDIQSLPIDNNALGPTSLNDELRNSQDSLRTLADETGGFAAVNQNDLRNAFSRIIQDNSSYYVLGYYSNDTRRDGRFRKLQVRVKQPGLEVRARRGYVAPKGKVETKSAANEKASAALRTALDSPVPVSGLGLTLTAAPLKGAAPNASVVLALEIAPGAMKFTEDKGSFNNDVEIAVVAMDQSGKIRDGGHDVVNLRLKTAYESVLKGGVRLMRRLEVPPGRYQLRIGARETGGGNIGSVLYDLDVPDFAKADLSMSGLLLTSASASRVPTANPDPEFKDVLPAPPVALRDFPRGDSIALFTEVYDNQTKAAHRVAIKTSVLADDGKVVFTTSDERKSEELQGGKGGYGYTASIPLKDFAPGRYVLRVEAQTLLSGGGTASKELEFRVK